MAVKGAAAKEQVIKRISSAFGEDFIGEVDKKIYVWANDNGEKVQIAISLTCPKNFVENISSVKSKNDEILDFSAETPSANVEISDEEKKNIAELMAKLGL
jgi:hypothetical protein